MFTVEQRDRVRDRVLGWAEADARIVAGAAVGSLATGPGDRWSDLDLTFGVADRAPLEDVLEEWTGRLEREFDSVHLLDLTRETSIYRVFLLPGCLQVDLSFTPAADFGRRGPRFKLLFGQAVERPHAEPPSPRDLFGLAVHHAVRARFCIERGRLWQAEYWIRELRGHALELACLRRGLEAQYGRGLDRLPAEVLEPAANALVRSIEREELLRALSASLAVLLREADEAGELAAKAEPLLREVTKRGGLQTG